MTTPPRPFGDWSKTNLPSWLIEHLRELGRRVGLADGATSDSDAAIQFDGISPPMMAGAESGLDATQAPFVVMVSAHDLDALTSEVERLRIEVDALSSQEPPETPDLLDILQSEGL